MSKYGRGGAGPDGALFGVSTQAATLGSKSKQARRFTKRLQYLQAINSANYTVFVEAASLHEGRVWSRAIQEGTKCVHVQSKMKVLTVRAGLHYDMNSFVIWRHNTLSHTHKHNWAWEQFNAWQ